jgi:fucose permease
VVLLLIIIYIAFISLGLPDSLFGVSWPLMHVEFGLDNALAGVVTIIVIVGTIVMSLLTGKLIRKIGTGKLTALSVLLTALSLIGISFSPTIWFILPCSILLGIGAGAVDSALNHFVATHYRPQHMNWLHCFWGVGVTVSPLIMSAFLVDNGNWRDGYLTIGLIQIFLTLILLISLPLWKQKKPQSPWVNGSQPEQSIEEKKVLSRSPFRPLKIRGVTFAILILGLYCAWENILGTWGATFLIRTRSVDPAMAARWISFYYGGIMGGRFIAGFLSYKVNDKTLIRAGIGLASFGALILLLPLGKVTTFIALLLIGLGFAPIFPSSIHATADRFGKEAAPDIVGYQMAGAYSGILILQPIIGWVSSKTTFAILPYFFIGFALILFILTERLNQTISQPLASIGQ